MKTIKQLRNNRISILFSLTAILLFSFISNAQIYVNASNQVGIGTLSPGYQLHAVTAATTGNGFYLDANTITTGLGLTIPSNGLTTGSAINVSSTSTAGTASNSSKIFNIARSGANANSSHTAYGLYSSVTNTGTTSTNVGGYFSASGATNNYGLIVANGNVGIGTSSPTSILHTIASGSKSADYTGNYLSNTATLTGSTPRTKYGLDIQSTGSWSVVSGAAVNVGLNVNATGGDYNYPAIFSGGNVGIGTTAPAYQLELSTNSAGKPTSSTWSITSDIRTKTNVKSYVHGLDLIRKVKLVSYQYNGLAHTPKGENGIGVIAQDFQNVFPNSIKPFIVKDSTKSETFFGVDLHELFVTNVGAVQELDSIVSTQNTQLKTKMDSLTTVSTKLDSTVKTQNSKIDDLQNQIDQLTNRINTCCSSGTKTVNTPNNNTSGSPQNTSATNVTLNNTQTIVLEQNVPNPFAEQTTINYSLPDNTGKAQMLFYNSDGKLIQSVELIQKGQGQLNVFASDLSSGIYTYTLVVDGKIVETKKMLKQ